MTDKPTPKEIENLFVEETGFATDDFPAAIFDFARAVLAKWGQPAQAAEPFCWHWENTFNGGTGTVKKNPETLGINMSHPDYKWTALYTAPQTSPTAQVADSVLEDAARSERERICAAIKAEDDYCVEQGDYMLDSDDCIKIARGDWVRPDFSVVAARKQGANHD